MGFFSLQAAKTGLRFSTRLFPEVCELFSMIFWEFSTASLNGRNKAYKAVASPLVTPHSCSSWPFIECHSYQEDKAAPLRQELCGTGCVGNMVLMHSWNRAELCQCIELQRLGHSHLSHGFRSLFLKMFFLVLHKNFGTD